jgi:hypothetical protein
VLFGSLLEQLCYVLFIVISCLLVIFHFTAWLDLSSNSLMGTIPNQLGLLTKLSKSSVAWLLVVMNVMCFSLFSHACHFSFYSLVGNLQQ